MGPARLLWTVVTNVGARGLAIAGLALATVVVARGGGSADVGAYALVRLLSGLVGVVGVAGLPGAMAYFLAEPRRTSPRLWPTLFTVMALGSLAALAAWLLLTPLFSSVFFPGTGTLVVAAAGLAVVSQIVLTCAKTALQGLEDHRASNRTIALEEWAFVPCYLAVVAAGVQGMPAILVGLVAADLAVAVPAWHWVARRAAALTPALRVRWGQWDRRLARRIVAYGMRGQLGGILVLVNLRLDFVVLAAFTTPSVVGIYAIASKYAELLRQLGVALTWVTYPHMAGRDALSGAREARRMVVPALGLVAMAGIPAALLARPVIVLFYGSDFTEAARLAQILVVGMLLSGAAGVASGYFYGRGRPGLNSALLGLGLLLTVVLDLALIPHFEALGASLASTISYLVADFALVATLLRSTRTILRRAEAAAGETTATGKRDAHARSLPASTPS